MEYKQALEKAWDDIAKAAGKGRYPVRFLKREYTVDAPAKTVIYSADDKPAKEYIAIILLHYLMKRLLLGALPPLAGEWIEFRELEGGEGYYDAYKKRTVDFLIKKYGAGPGKILKDAEDLGGCPGKIGDASIVIEAFENVPLLITIWKGDEEFAPEANILFDRTISGIFCTEDIVVMTDIVVRSLK